MSVVQMPPVSVPPGAFLSDGSPKDICVSGGAAGSDIAWGEAAARAGHRVCHMSFEEHRTSAPLGTRLVLSKSVLEMADEHCRRAARTLGRRFPPRSDYVAYLMRRNWHIVALPTVERCYAAAEIIEGQVQGGTGWGIEMFLNRFDRTQEQPCWVFDLNLKLWRQWVPGGGVDWDSGGLTDWCILAPGEKPPRPEGRYAAIGTRNLTYAGAQAITELYKES